MYFGYDPESDEIINMTTGAIYRRDHPLADPDNQVWGDTTGLDLNCVRRDRDGELPLHEWVRGGHEFCDCDTCRASDIPDINDIEQMAWDLLDAIHTLRRRT